MKERGSNDSELWRSSVLILQSVSGHDLRAPSYGLWLESVNRYAKTKTADYADSARSRRIHSRT